MAGEQYRPVVWPNLLSGDCMRTKNGSPRHPLSVRSTQPLERWTP